MTPARLDKQSNVDKNFFCCNSSLLDKVDAWCNHHAIFCLSILFILVSLLFVALCFALCGASATESGLQYNQFNSII